MSMVTRRNRGNTTSSTLLAALIVAGALVGSAFMISQSMTQMSGSLEEMKTALESATSPREPEQQAAARRGPDPARRYTVKTDGSPARGPEDAKVTIVELSDFQCPFCSRVKPTLKQLLGDYPDDVQIVFKHLPLDFHTKAPAAHAASEAAHKQGKFWEMHDKIFSNQAEMAPEKYEQYAAEIGLDVERFKKDAASAEIKQRVDADKKEAASLGVTGTPSFFINGRYLSGAQPVDAFKRLIDEELGRKDG
jgi:protein-disulfide isomerase